jgi:hypothetical protein
MENRMKTRAALGISVHSGWGALVAIAIEAGDFQLIDRWRLEIIEADMAGAKQPYHFVEEFELRAAEQHLKACAATSERLASAAMRDIVEKLNGVKYEAKAGVILLSSGRALPPLPQILASHALIHTAEGVFFRQIFREAFERSGVRVSGIPSRELESRAQAAFGRKAASIQKRIADFGKTIGPPWTSDHKQAALAAAIVLAERNR